MIVLNVDAYNNNNNNNNNNNYFILVSMSSSAFALIGDTFPARIGIWKCWFLRSGGKLKYPGKDLSEQRREPTTNSTRI